jgi:hypothetical protein
MQYLLNIAFWNHDNHNCVILSKKKLIMLFHQNFKFSMPIAQDSQMTVNVKYLYMQLSIISTIRIRLWL